MWYVHGRADQVSPTLEMVRDAFIKPVQQDPRLELDRNVKLFYKKAKTERAAKRAAVCI